MPSEPRRLVEADLERLRAQLHGLFPWIAGIVHDARDALAGATVNRGGARLDADHFDGALHELGLRSLAARRTAEPLAGLIVRLPVVERRFARLARTPTNAVQAAFDLCQELQLVWNSSQREATPARLAVLAAYEINGIEHCDEIESAIDRLFQLRHGLAEQAAEPVAADGIAAGAPAAAIRSGRRKRGRPARRDPKADQRIYDAWLSGQYPDYQSLAAELNIKARDVERAIRAAKRRADRSA